MPVIMNHIQADFSSGKAIFFQGTKTPPVRSSNPTIQFWSDLWNVPMLGTLLSYERFLLRSFGSPWLRFDLLKQMSKLFQGVNRIFPWERQNFSRENGKLFQGVHNSFPGRTAKLFQGVNNSFPGILQENVENCSLFFCRQ